MSWLLEFLVTGVFFNFYLAIIFFSPGWLLIKHLKLPYLDKWVWSIVLGFGSVSAYIYLLREIQVPFWLIELPLILIGFRQLINLNRQRLKLVQPNRTQIFFGLVLLIITFVHGSVLMQSALPVSSGMAYVELSFHDSMQHLSFIRRLQESSQVSHPGFAGAQLRNYHYLVDSTLAAITRFSFVSLNEAYYRYYPFFVSTIFSLSIFVCLRRLVRNELVAAYGVVFTLFAGNVSFWASFWRGPEYKWGANNLMINPLIDILQNPAAIFVLAQLLLVLYGLKMYLIAKTHRNLWKVIICLTAGTMIGFKAWGGIIIMLGLGAAAMWHTFSKQKFDLWVVVVATGLLSAVLFLPGYDSATSASPVWIPGWTLRQMFQDADRWNSISQIFKEEAYLYQGNYLGLAKMYSQWVGIYILGNYWIRTVGLAAILGLVLRIRHRDGFDAAVWTMTLASLVIPLLFNQGRMAYDIEQFSPYAILMTSIATVIILWQLVKHIKQRFTLAINWWLVGLAGGLVVVSSVANFTSLKARLLPSKKIITQNELEIYKQVDSITANNAVILLYPSHRNIATLEFAALTNRDTYYSGRTLSVITGEPFEDRLKELELLFSDEAFNRQEYLIDTPITHLFVHITEPMDFLKYDWPMELIFENPAGRLYQFKY